MKRKLETIVISILVFTTIAIVACAKNEKKSSVELKTPIDTLAYALGVANTGELKEYLYNGLKVDTTLMKEFVKGFLDAQKSRSKKENAYLAGMQLGKHFADNMVPNLNTVLFPTEPDKEINKEAFYEGFTKAAAGNYPLLSYEEARNYSESRIAKIKETEKKLSDSIAQAAEKKFMEEVKKINGAVPTGSGLYYQVLKHGNGAKPQKTDKVKIHYHGTTPDGTVFDSSVERGEPIELEIEMTVPGFSEALQLMPVGSKYRAFIPSTLAYGESGAGDQIKPFTPIIFELDLLEILKK